MKIFRFLLHAIVMKTTVEQDTSLDTIISNVTQKYDVCSDDFYNEIKEFVDNLFKNGIVV